MIERKSRFCSADPSYTRTDLTDALHEAMGFRTDYETITARQFKKIIKFTKQ